MANDTKLKRCYKCKNEYPLTGFHKDKSRYDGVNARCKSCHIADSIFRKKTNLAYKTYHNIWERCNRKNHKSYKSYGAKGIRCLITPKELHVLVLRDKAMDMIQPSIDRIDSKGHYIFENCRYMELKENIRRRTLEIENEIQ